MTDQVFHPFYLSFADPEGGWLGACMVRATEPEPGVLGPTHPLAVAASHDCNPGGEVMLLRMPEEGAARIPAEFWNVLLTAEDLLAVGEIVDPERNELVKGTPEEITEMLERGHDG